MQVKTTVITDRMQNVRLLSLVFVKAMKCPNNGLVAIISIRMANPSLSGISKMSRSEYMASIMKP